MNKYTSLDLSKKLAGGGCKLDSDFGFVQMLACVCTTYIYGKSLKQLYLLFILD